MKTLKNSFHVKENLSFFFIPPIFFIFLMSLFKNQKKKKKKMIFLFFSLFSFVFSKDVFVPINATTFPYVPTVTEEKMWQIINTTDFVVVLVAPSNRPEILDQHHSFASASTLFAHGGPFLYLDCMEPIKLTQKYLVTPPSLFLFKNHTLWFCSPYPMSEISLLFTLRHFFSEKVDTAETIGALYSQLGRFRFTLITSPELLEKTLDLRFTVAAYLGAMDIIVTTRKNLNALKIPMNEIALFREEDHAITPLKLDFDAFFEASMPVFRNFVLSDFEDPDAIYACLMTDELTDQMGEFLYEQAELHPDFIVGWLPRHLRYIAERSTLQGYPGDNFIAFNPIFRYYFPNDKHVSYVLNYEFNKNDYNKSFGSYLDDIMWGKLAYKFHSENLTRKDKEGLVQKLNGVTYEHFLRNKRDDLVIMYLRSTKDDNKFALNTFNLAAEKVVKEWGLKNVSFAYINTYNNSGDYYYPYIPDYPHIRFFPHVNHSLSLFFLHSLTCDDIASFVVRCMDPRPNITLPEKDKEEFRNEAGHFVRIMNSLERHEKDRMTDYFKNMWIDLGVPINVKADVESNTYYGDEIPDSSFIPTRAPEPQAKKETKETPTDKSGDEL